MTHQSWWTSIWSLCLNQQSYLFHYPDRTRLNIHYRHLKILPRILIGKKKKCNATVYRGHWGEVGLLGNKSHTQIPQIFNSPQKEKKKRNGKKLFMEITIKGVSCSIYWVICSYFPFSISLHFIHLCHPDTSYSPQEDDGGGTLSI